MNDDSQEAADYDRLIADFVSLLSVEPIDTDLYRGHRQEGGIGRVFGGEVIAQALAAAEQTVETEAIPHSLHAYFMRPGSEDHPILYEVDRDRDGRSFSTRRVLARQEGKPIFCAAVNFQVPEPGASHQAAMPDVPPPEEVPSQAEQMRAQIEKLPEPIRHRFLRPRAIEMRPVFGFGSPAGGERGEPAMQLWFRATARFPDDSAVHRWALAHVSDSNLLGPAMRPHGVSWQTPGTQTASLDHAIWLHEEARVDDWLLYVAESPWSGHARGFSRGQIFTRDGRLVASTAQEGLVRILGRGE